eukprot:sb/3477992/
MYDLVRNHGQHPPDEKFKVGHQNDGSGPYWAVLVDTPHGQIPGKIAPARGARVTKGRAGKAWYSYGGKEVETPNFSHFMGRPGCQVSLQKSSPPLRFPRFKNIF